MATYPSGQIIVPHEFRCPHQEAGYLRPEWCPKCTVEDSVAAYLEIKRLYYSGQPVMDDLAFDRWELRLRERWPEEKAFWGV